MTYKYYTVEQLSEMLAIHPKTIQRYIREGKLHANKIGKSWRVTEHDLSMFIENKKSVPASEVPHKKQPIKYRCKVSAVVDINVDRQDDAMRILNMLTGALHSKPPEYEISSMHSQYIMEENKLRITLWGGIRFMEVMMDSISTLIEQMEGA